MVNTSLSTPSQSVQQTQIAQATASPQVSASPTYDPGAAANDIQNQLDQLDSELGSVDNSVASGEPQ